MDKKDFTNAIDTILPMDGVKEIIWDTIQTSKKKSPTKKNWLSLAASLVFICLVIYSVPVIAAEIQFRLFAKMSSYEPLAEQIETNIFSKTDDHLCITVDELLSDGMRVYMFVHYTALDDLGREWLSEYTYSCQGNNPDLNLQPYIEDFSTSGSNYSHPTFEQTELATENERFFIIGFESSSRDYDSGQGIFTFPMTEKKESSIIDVSRNIEILSYELKSEETISELYDPVYIELSPISFVIYAKNNGVYERIGNKETWLVPNEELNLLKKTTYLLMEDGTKQSIYGDSSCTTHSKETNHYSDLVLLSGFFKENNDVYPEVPILIKPEKVMGIEIKGNTYYFEK